jgi:hypothetical protein
MSNEWTNSATNDVLYPDDLAGYGPLSVDSEPIEAEDVPSENAKYGTFAKTAEGVEPDWIATPRQLRVAIGQMYDNQGGLPVTFDVLEAERGPRDDSEWTFEVKPIDPETDL